MPRPPVQERSLSKAKELLGAVLAAGGLTWELVTPHLGEPSGSGLSGRASIQSVPSPRPNHKGPQSFRVRCLLGSLLCLSLCPCFKQKTVSIRLDPVSTPSPLGRAPLASPLKALSCAPVLRKAAHPLGPAAGEATRGTGGFELQWPVGRSPGKRRYRVRQEVSSGRQGRFFFCVWGAAGGSRICFWVWCFLGSNPYAGQSDLLLGVVLSWDMFRLCDPEGCKRRDAVRRRREILCFLT